MVLEKLEHYACYKDEDIRVVSVDIAQDVSYKEPNYITTTIVIKALDDNAAHKMDSEKWKDGHLYEQLDKALVELVGENNVN